MRCDFSYNVGKCTLEFPISDVGRDRLEWKSTHQHFVFPLNCFVLIRARTVLLYNIAKSWRSARDDLCVQRPELLVVQPCWGGPWCASGLLIIASHNYSCEVNFWQSTEWFQVSGRALRGAVQRAIICGCVTSFTDSRYTYIFPLTLSLLFCLLLPPLVSTHRYSSFIQLWITQHVCLSTSLKYMMYWPRNSPKQVKGQALMVRFRVAYRCITASPQCVSMLFM